MTNKTTKETTMIKKDPFGFNKAINYDKLNDPNVLKTLEKIFKDKPQVTSYKIPGQRSISNANKGLIHKRQASSVMYDRPEVSYKKAVNTLKRSIKR